MKHAPETAPIPTPFDVSVSTVSGIVENHSGRWSPNSKGGQIRTVIIEDYPLLTEQRDDAQGPSHYRVWTGRDETGRISYSESVSWVLDPSAGTGTTVIGFGKTRREQPMTDDDHGRLQVFVNTEYYRAMAQGQLKTKWGGLGSLLRWFK